MPMHTSDEEILTTHIGSLPRTESLLDLLARESTGEALSTEEFDEAVADATRRVIRKQAEVGIDVANNGEQSRTGFHIHLTNRLRGFGDPAPAPFWNDVEEFPEFADSEFSYPDTDPDTGAPLRPAVTEGIEYEGEEYARKELETFFAALEETDETFDETFVTAPSPGIVATSLPNEYYDSHEEYLFAVADALRTEYDLVAQSDALLQVDAPDLLHTHHRSFLDGRSFPTESVERYREIVAAHVEAINEALATVPRERVRLHTCWGNYEGPHHRDVELVDVLPELYELDVGALAIEGSSPRHEHEYEAFSEHPLPDDMVFLPGVVDVKTNIVDHPDTVARRIERAADAIGDPTRIVAAPDCGFGTLAWSGAVEEIAWAKLEAMVEGAQRASEALF